MRVEFMDEGYTAQYAEWMQMKCGKFSGSEISDLLVEGKKKDEYFGVAGHSYIRKKLAEILTGIVVEINGVPAMEYGNSLELDGCTAFEKHVGLKVSYMGKVNPKFFQWSDYSGSSPDGLIEAENAIIEIKCPYNSAEHVRHLFLDSADDLKIERKDYYAQLMMNLLCTGKKKAYFVSYDPRISIASLRLKILIVYRDEPFIENLKERISEAEKYLKVLYASLNENELVA